MSRYINADALIKDLKRQYMFLFGTDELPSGIQGVIENFPTADVVEVVRCKDCKFYQDNNGGYPNPECKWIDGETPNSDDFCSFAERRTE